MWIVPIFLWCLLIGIWIILFREKYYKNIFKLNKEDLYIFEEHLLNKPKKMVYLTEPEKHGIYMHSAFMFTKIIGDFYLFKELTFSTKKMIKLIDLKNQTESAVSINKFNL